MKPLKLCDKIIVLEKVKFYKNIFLMNFIKNLTLFMNDSF